MLIPSKWYQSSSVSGDLAGSPANMEFSDVFSQSKLEAKIDEITDRLCHNIEKIFEDAISRIKLGSGVLHEDFEEDEDQVCESASSELSFGEEEPASHEEKMVEELEISNSDRYFFSGVSGLSGGAMVEKADLEINRGNQYFCSATDGLFGGFRSVAVVEMSEGGLESSTICFSDAKTSRFGQSLSEFASGGSGGGKDFSAGRYGGRKSSGQGGVAGEKQSNGCISLTRESPRGMFNRGGAGGSGSGGGPGFYAGETSGVVGCWSSECGQGAASGSEIMYVELCSGVRNGDFSGGFSGGSDLDGGTLVSSRTRPLVSGGINGGHLELLLLGVFQKCLEREGYEGSLRGSLVGLERKSEMEYASKGILVIPLIAQIQNTKDLNQLWSPATNVMKGQQTNPSTKDGLTDLRPNFPSPTLITQLVNYHPLAFQLIPSLLIRPNSLTHKSQLCISHQFLAAHSQSL